MSNGSAPTDHVMSDKELVALYPQNPNACFKELYDRYSKRIYNLCLYMVGDFAVAEELTQEVFLQLHLHVGTFRGDAQFYSWLHRVGINQSLMYLRKKKLPMVSLSDGLFDRDDDSLPMHAKVGGRDPSLVSVPDRITLEHLIGQLPKGFRKAILLHDILGFEHKEIAAMGNHSVGSSKSQLHKARVRLRDSLTWKT